MPPQVPLMWKLSPPIHNVRGRGVGRKLVGGKFHEGGYMGYETDIPNEMEASEQISVLLSNYLTM